MSKQRFPSSDRTMLRWDINWRSRVNSYRECFSQNAETKTINADYIINQYRVSYATDELTSFLFISSY